MKILIVEDDKSVADYIHDHFTEYGYSADLAHDGKIGLSKALNNDYDVMVLDRMLPSMSGLALLDAVRAAGKQTPAIVLSAKGEVEDRIKGLKSGADDYMVKPFAFEELLARVEVIAARNQQAHSATELSAKDLVLDLINRTVTRQSTQIDLQSKEFKLLEFLLKNKGKIVTRTMLLEKVWSYNFDPQTNVIDVHVSRLRNKIDKGFDTPIIETVRGMGYLITD